MGKRTDEQKRIAPSLGQWRRDLDEQMSDHRRRAAESRENLLERAAESRSEQEFSDAIDRIGAHLPSTLVSGAVAFYSADSNPADPDILLSVWPGSADAPGTLPVIIEFTALGVALDHLYAPVSRASVAAAIGRSTVPRADRIKTSWSSDDIERFAGFLDDWEQTYRNRRSWADHETLLEAGLVFPLDRP